MNKQERLQVAGFALMAVPSGLLMLGVVCALPAIAFLVVFAVAPGLRAVLGDSDGRPLAWGPQAARLLDLIPLVAATSILVSVAMVAWSLHRMHWSVAQNVELGLSLWGVLLLGSCIGHELIHRRGVARVIGRVLTGVMGYPLLEHELLVHHASPGNVKSAEWPGVHETVWQFSARRLRKVGRNALRDLTKGSEASGGERFAGLAMSCASLAGTATVFLAVGGAAGLAFYLAVCLVNTWSIQAIIYIQHWGLGDDNLAEARSKAFAWEDRCQLQVWLTLGICYHQAHHGRMVLPYYRMQALADAPRQPAGYAILLFVAMVPRAWRALMIPTLAKWRQCPNRQRAAGRRLICLPD
jgi:alkane 1-monooxygenase